MRNFNFFLVFVLSISLSACITDNPQNDFIDRNNEYNGGSITTPDSSIKSPDVSGIVESKPVNALPNITDEELRGNAQIAGATAIISLQRTTASFTGSNVNVLQNQTYGTIVEITNNGTYVIQGTLEQGFVSVSKKDLNVTIILNGVNIYCKNYAAITCLKKSNVTIELAAGSTNYLTDGGQGASNGKYNYGYDDEEQPNATLLIRKDLTIKGTGKLIVNGNLNNGIGSRANLKIEEGNIYVSALNNAIKGNDNITISGGSFALVSQEDGIKSEEIDEGLGNINIIGGEFSISSVQDAIQASTNLIISNAVMKIKTSGGSSAKTTTESAKGLKAAKSLTIHSGTLDIDSNDDCIHSDSIITINDGTLTIASGDDGIHADKHLTINNGIINISKCYEGLESQNITLKGGIIKILSSDDGINIAEGRDASGSTQNRPNQGRPGGGGGGFGGVINGTLTITGGEYYINSSGDGIDSNGNIVISGGNILIMGPTSNADAAFDYDGTATMTGGTLVALGSSQMAQQPGSSSTQYSVLIKFSNNVAAGSEIKLETNSGVLIVGITTLKSTRSLVVCSPLLQKGTSYKVIANGSVLKTFTINNTITNVN